MKSYYGRGTLMTKGVDEYLALNLNYEGTAYEIYPDYEWTDDGGGST